METKFHIYDNERLVSKPTAQGAGTGFILADTDEIYCVMFAPPLHSLLLNHENKKELWRQDEIRGTFESH